MPIEDHLRCVKQAMRNKKRVAPVKPGHVDIVRGTLRLAGFTQRDNMWFLPKETDYDHIAILYEKKNKSGWMFNIWLYDQYRRYRKNNGKKR